MGMDIYVSGKVLHTVLSNAALFAGEGNLDMVRFTLEEGKLTVTSTNRWVLLNQTLEVNSDSGEGVMVLGLESALKVATQFKGESSVRVIFTPSSTDSGFATIQGVEVVTVDRYVNTSDVDAWRFKPTIESSESAPLIVNNSWVSKLGKIKLGGKAAKGVDLGWNIQFKPTSKYVVTEWTGRNTDINVNYQAKVMPIYT